MVGIKFGNAHDGIFLLVNNNSAICIGQFVFWLDSLLKLPHCVSTRMPLVFGQGLTTLKRLMTEILSNYMYHVYPILT